MYHSKYTNINLDVVRQQPLTDRGYHLRKLVMRAIVGGGRGHIGPALSLIELLMVLYDQVLCIRPDQPEWEDRDRFILSKGHGCLGLYALLADKGFFDLSELDKFCNFNSILGGHPEVKTPGVEASTGALGHGLSIGVGMALAAKARKKTHRIFVLMGDGEVNEGSVWEAASSAHKHKLGNLYAIIDYNKMQSAGNVENIQPMEPLAEKWRSFGFWVKECNGHDTANIKNIFDQAQSAPHDQPRLILAHTIKGKGIPAAENNASWHHKAKLPDDILADIYKALED